MNKLLVSLEEICCQNLLNNKILITPAMVRGVNCAKYWSGRAGDE